MKHTPEDLIGQKRKVETPAQHNRRVDIDALGEPSDSYSQICAKADAEYDYICSLSPFKAYSYAYRAFPCHLLHIVLPVIIALKARPGTWPLWILGVSAILLTGTLIFGWIIASLEPASFTSIRTDNRFRNYFWSLCVHPRFAGVLYFAANDIIHHFTMMSILCLAVIAIRFILQLIW